MDLGDYHERPSFTPQEIEHILQIPMIDVVELLAQVRRAPGGRFEGDGCRALVTRLARGRLFADLIARQAVNAEPEIRRGPESTEPGRFQLVNTATGEEFTVRFSGDLRDYLDDLIAASRSSEPKEPDLKP